MKSIAHLNRMFKWLGLVMAPVLVLSLAPLAAPRQGHLFPPPSAQVEASALPAYAAYAPHIDGTTGGEVNPLLWDRPWGNTANNISFWPNISPDGQGNLYAVIETDNAQGGKAAVLVKFDQNGWELWHTDLGWVGPHTYDLSADKSGNVYVYGGVNDQVVLTKYGPGGDPLWTQQVDTDIDYGSCYVSADPVGNVYITQAVNVGSNQSADWDVELTKYDGNGVKQWSQLIGTSGKDAAVGVSANSDAWLIYVAGTTDGSFPGYTFSGDGWDGFVACYAPDGTRRWVNQQAGLDITDIAADSDGNAYTTETELLNGCPYQTSAARPTGC